MNTPDARSLSADAQHALRERAVAAALAGAAVTAAAQFGVPRQTVSGWLAAYRRGGPPPSNRPPAAAARGRSCRPPARHARLLATLAAPTPDRLGLGEALWPRDAVAAGAARELGGRRPRWVWGRWPAAAGFTPRKPARRADEQDPAAVDR